MVGAISYDFHSVDNFGYGYEFSTPPYQYNPVYYYTYLTRLPKSQGYLASSALQIRFSSEPFGTDWQPQNLEATNKNSVLPSQFLRPYVGWGNITNHFEGG